MAKKASAQKKSPAKAGPTRGKPKPAAAKAKAKSKPVQNKPKPAAKKVAPKSVKKVDKNLKPAPKVSKSSVKPSKPIKQSKLAKPQAARPVTTGKTPPKPSTTGAPSRPATVGKSAASAPSANNGKTPLTGKAAVRAAAEASAARKVYIPEVARPTGMYGGIQLSTNPKPFPRKSPYSPKEIALLKQALVNERVRLRQELSTLEGMAFQFEGSPSESPGHSTHIAEHASDMQSNETNLVVRSLDEERLAQVEEALQRIEDRQQYGLCVACGDKIGIERLIAQPHAHLCMDCRRRYERERRL